MFILGLVVVFFLISIVLFTIFMTFFLFYIFAKYSKDLNELGADKLLLLNPFVFPVGRVREIMKEKRDKKLQRYLKIIHFYKLYTLIGVIICVPCMYFLANSKLGLE